MTSRICFECRKANNFNNNKRMLVIINVLGSAGPLRFIVNEEDLVGGVIDTALKLYAKEGRLPTLGSDSTKFLLYSSHAASDGNRSNMVMMITSRNIKIIEKAFDEEGIRALSAWDEIGSCEGRNFVLCKKAEVQSNMSEARSHMISQKQGGTWRTWLNKSLSFSLSSQ